MLSVIIAAYNEEKNLPELLKRLSSVITKQDEVIVIDDGSVDETFNVLLDLRKKYTQLKIIKFRQNWGQTAAWDAGMRHAKGELIITMDADLQNDPKDIPKLIAKLNEGYDHVTGWRQHRQDSFSKKIFSLFSRKLRSIIIDDKTHDSGCSLKIYKRHVVSQLRLYGEMHRYITQIIAMKGFRVAEIPVSHHARKFGKSKYNMIRLPKGFLDLLVVGFWQKYSARPIHLFGGLGIIMSIMGGLLGSYLVYQKFFLGMAIADRPLLLLVVLLMVLGLQFLIFGLIADILMRMYYKEGQHYEVEIIKA